MKYRLSLLGVFLSAIQISHAQFITEVIETGANITLSAVQAKGSDYIAAGSENNKVLLCRIDASGAVINSREITVVNDSVLPYVTSMIIDADGQVVLTGYRATDDVYQYTSFVLKYNYIAGSVTWIKLFENPGSTFTRVIEKSATGPYIVCGQSIVAPNGEEGILFSVDRSTGSLTLLNNYNYNNSSESYFSMIKAAGGFYTSGRYNFDGGGSSRMRGVLSKFDGTGAEIFTNAYLRNTTTDVGRMYSADLCYAHNSIYMTVHGDETGSLLNDDVFVLRSNTDGTLKWANLYNLTNYSDDGSLRAIKSKGNYVYVLGALNDGAPDYTGNQFLMKLDTAGNVVWANSYNVLSNSRQGSANSLLINGSNIITVGYQLDPFTGFTNGVFMLVKTSNGILPSGCSDPEPVTVTVKSTANYGATLNAMTHTYTISDPVTVSGASDEAFDVLCVNAGKEEPFAEAEVTISPNPGNGIATIHLQKEMSGIEIYNSAGQVIFTTVTDGLNAQIDISAQPAGLYWVKVFGSSGEVLHTSLLVKE